MPALKNFKTVCDIFVTLTEEYSKVANRPILSYKENNKYVGVSFENFKEIVEDFACGLSELGLKRGDKIAILSENRPEWIYTDFSALAIGLVDVPIYPITTADQIEFMLNNSETKAVAVSNKFQLNKILKVRSKLKFLKFIVVYSEKDVTPNNDSIYSFGNVMKLGKSFKRQNPKHIKENLTIANENDVATIIYTSGTTGEPKGVILTHKNIVTGIHNNLAYLDINKSDRLLSFLPFCHIFERNTGYYSALAAGADLWLAESIEKVSNNLLEARPTIMTTVPRLFERIYAKIQKNIEMQPKFKRDIFKWAVETGMEYHKAKKSGNISAPLSIKYKAAQKLALDKIRNITGGRFRFFVSGGAALAKELGEFFEAFGLIILEGYGLTETSPVISCNRENDYKFGTVGRIWPNLEVKFAPDGEILVKGPTVMQGYYKNQKETDAVIKDGWFHTGDLGEFDSEGFLKITDRKKNLFKTSTGKYVAPTPIENLFLSSKYIEQFVLIGDRRMFLTALIVPDFDALKEYADSNNIDYDNMNDLVNNETIYSLVEKDLAVFQKQLTNYEKVRKFVLLDKPFTIETGELTPKLSVKRKVIEEKYKNLIEEMYAKFEKNSD